MEYNDPQINRREFLKISGSAFAGIGLHSISSVLDIESIVPDIRLGRTTRSMKYFDRPSFSGKELGFYNTDAVIEIIDEAIGDNEKKSHNPIWFRTLDGWVHSSYVQPVRNELNEPIMNIPSNGLLCEVTVPYTQAWYITETKKKRVYRFYYGTTHWVTFAFRTDTGIVWYKVIDDRYNKSYVVQAEHLRPVTEKEVSPLSRSVRDKRIEIDLNNQKMLAFEDEKPVYKARIATGYFEGDTPLGEFKVERKQPSRHMAGGGGKRKFDLPGVPWVCYISWTGVSLHGTYWHNNFGVPQSHGCINLSIEAAKWVYRWTDPFVPVNEDYIEKDNGTKVIVY